MTQSAEASQPKPSSRRQRLVGHRYECAPGLTAEIRRSCRDELKMVYDAADFDEPLLEKLRPFGKVEVLRASLINPKMKDLVRIVGERIRIEFALRGQLLLAFIKPRGRARSRHELEAVLREWARTR